MIREIKAFKAICDCCGFGISDDTEDEYDLYEERAELEDCMNDDGWLIRGDKCYCPECAKEVLKDEKILEEE